MQLIQFHLEPRDSKMLDEDKNQCHPKLFSWRPQDMKPNQNGKAIAMNITVTMRLTLVRLAATATATVEIFVWSGDHLHMPTTSA